MAKAAALRKPKKKVNPLDKEGITYIDYKDTALLRKFISDRGKIRARRVTGVTLAAAAADRPRGQERPRDGAAAVHGHGSLRGGTDMKIILTQEVSGLGTPGDIVEVKDGYGRNYLLPQGFAIRVDQGRARSRSRSIKRARSAREIRDLGHANEVKAPARGPQGHAVGARRQRRPPVRLGHPGRGRRRGQGRRRSGPGPAPPRAARSHQVDRRLPGAGPAAPGGHRDVRPERQQGQVSTTCERAARSGRPFGVSAQAVGAVDQVGELAYGRVVGALGRPARDPGEIGRAPPRCASPRSILRQVRRRVGDPEARLRRARTHRPDRTPAPTRTPRPARGSRDPATVRPPGPPPPSTARPRRAAPRTARSRCAPARPRRRRPCRRGTARRRPPGSRTRSAGTTRRSTASNVTCTLASSARTASVDGSRRTNTSRACVELAHVDDEPVPAVGELLHQLVAVLAAHADTQQRDLLRRLLPYPRRIWSASVLPVLARPSESTTTRLDVSGRKPSRATR